MAPKTPATALRLLFLLSWVVFPYLVMGPLGDRLTSIPLRLGVFILLTLIGAWLLSRSWGGMRRVSALLITTLGYASAYKLASFIPEVSTYPFSMGWSETSRYYYASLFFAERLYGGALPLSVLHPTRYLMQSLPFLIPDSPLWLHRLWQVLLWVGMSGATSWLLWRRLHQNPGRESHAPGTGMGVILFSFLFLFQGPVYYHLLVMAALVLWLYDRKHPWRTLVIVLLTSLWAGVSRINWLPVPGMLAAALYFLEKPVRGDPLAAAPRSHTGWMSVGRYLSFPAMWVILGSTAGYGMQEAYKLVSGNPPAVFGSSFTSDLLWYRLLPNPTYPLGILPSAILVSLPLLLLVGQIMWRSWRSYHIIRLLALAGILGVLFVGGVVVSVKIGGGSNLHNLDAYLVLLLVICSHIFFGLFIPDSPAPTLRLHRRAQSILLLLAVAIPCYFSIRSGGPLPGRDETAAQNALQSIREHVQAAAIDGGQILFISQRHLLTFDLLDVESIPLLPDYEQVFLMEMAMGGNRAYLNTFQAEVKAQHYALIVSGPLTTNLQGRAHSFGEENDAWVRQVSKPILCYYEPVLKLKEPGIMLLAPRQLPCE